VVCRLEISRRNKMKAELICDGLYIVSYKEHRGIVRASSSANAIAKVLAMVKCIVEDE